MEPVLFYGVPGGCSLASIIALEWLGKPYRLCRIEMLEHPWPAAYARLNPRMKTPCLLLGPGAALTESLAILQHVGAQGIDAGLGFDQGSAQYDRLNETLSYLVTDFFTSFAPLWKLYESTGLTEEERRRLRADGCAQVAREFGHVERMLEGRQWLLGGTTPTVADAYLFAVARWAGYHKVFDGAAAYPAAFGHAERMAALPAVRFALAVEADGATDRRHVTITALEASGWM